jgi:hypothetical protein
MCIAIGFVYARRMEEDDEVELATTVKMKMPHSKALSRALKAARAKPQ